MLEGKSAKGLVSETHIVNSESLHQKDGYKTDKGHLGQTAALRRCKHCSTEVNRGDAVFSVFFLWFVQIVVSTRNAPVLFCSETVLSGKQGQKNSLRLSTFYIWSVRAGTESKQ